MADEFDPLKQTNDKQPEPIYATIQKNTANTNDEDLLRSPFENILKLGDKSIDKSTEQKPKEEAYEKLNFTTSGYKAPVRSTNPFDDDVRKPSSSTNAPQQAPPPPPSNVPQQPPPSSPPQQQENATASDESYWKNTEEYHNRIYEPGPPPAYYPEEYYGDQYSSKRRGIAGAIDRLVTRFPALGIFYKQPPPPAMPSEREDEYVEETDEPPQLVDANQTARELTADELALNERYSNKSRTQIIGLQTKDETQPVDVCIHHDSYTLYSADVGRSVVEIYDMYGKLQHVIDDQTTLKFQPTSIAVAYDGTIIAASHFQHRLQMYSPDYNENEQYQDVYRFKQYKLGSPGHGLHQFHHPAGISMDVNDGYLYVCDRGNFRIQVMRPEGVCERVINLILNDQNQSPIPPIQTAHQRNGNQMVCLVGAGDALCFILKKADGPTYVEPLYIIDNDGLGLQGASGVVIDSHDRIFISDTGHHRIVICTPEGNYITHFGIEGDGPGELKRPCGLDITNDGTIVVADSGNKRLQLFGSIREQTIEDKTDDKNILLIDPEAPAL